MEEKRMTEKESIEVITAMIARTKRRYIGDGNIMLLWGYLTVAVTVLVWVLLVATHNQAWNWLWFLIWIIGGTLTPIMAKKSEFRKGVKNYTDTLTSRIWSVVGYGAIATTFMCLGFMLFKGLDAWPVMFVFALIIVPFAEIAEGVVINEKSLIAGGAIGHLAGIFVACCIASGVPLYATWIMPLMIVSFAAMMIVPGHIVNNKARRER